MPDRPTLSQIEEEARALAMEDGKTSKRERFRIRNQLRAKHGYGREKKKRGGLAGVWDRNKEAIGTIGGGLAASFIPGAGAFLLPALGGIAGGAAARGKFDTSNILGDSLGGVAGGAIPGVAGAIKSAFVPKAAAQAGTSAATMNAGASAAPMLNPIAGGPMLPPPVPQSAMQRVGSAVGKAASSAGSYLKNNPEVVGMAAQGAGQAMAANANRDIARDQLALQQRQQDDEEERRRRIAELLAPMFTQAQQQRNEPMRTPGLPQLMGGR